MAGAGRTHGRQVFQISQELFGRLSLAKHTTGHSFLHRECDRVRGCAKAFSAFQLPADHTRDVRPHVEREKYKNQSAPDWHPFLGWDILRFFIRSCLLSRLGMRRMGHSQVRLLGRLRGSAGLIRDHALLGIVREVGIRRRSLRILVG
eukprot:scaffold581_cov263-Pinguiococcus_pyrenoidosus.AAC.17